MVSNSKPSRSQEQCNKKHDPRQRQTGKGDSKYENLGNKTCKREERKEKGVPLCSRAIMIMLASSNQVNEISNALRNFPPTFNQPIRETYVKNREKKIQEENL